ncbi:MAG: MFS transporter [Dehalococcoidia bacterium]
MTSRRPPITLPGGAFYGWVIVAVSFMGNWITAPLNPVVFSIFIVSIRSELGVSLGTLAWCISLRQISAGVAAPVLGHLVDRYGPRWLGVGCAAWAGVCLSALSLASNTWWMYALFFISGFSGFGVFGGGQILTGVPPANWFVAKRGRAVSYATMGGGLGTASWSIISAYLVTTIGWREAWFIYGILIAAVLIPAYAILMRRHPEDVGLFPDGASAPPVEASSTPRPGSVTARQVTETNFTLKQAMRTTALWLMVLAFTFHTFATNTILFLRVPYWTDMGVSAGWIGVAVASDPFVVMLFTLIFGYMSERYRLALIGLTGGIFRALSMAALMVVSPHAIWPFAHSMTWGVGSAGMGTGQNLAIPAYFGRRAQGAIRGFTAPIMIGAGSVSPPLIGYFIDRGVLTDHMVFAGGAAMMFAAGAIFTLMRTPALPAPAASTSPARAESEAGTRS